MLSVEKLRTGTYSNWSQNEVASNLLFHEPKSIDEISTIIHSLHMKEENLRVVGAAHSFSPIAKPEHHAMSLHQMRGLVSVDMKQQQATFWAGTYLHEIGPKLASYGMALENMGDIAEQTIAGAISTGTHGTGLKLSSISNQVFKWGIIDGKGVYREITRGQDDLSEALHISLGLLGVVVQVTFQALPLYALRYSSEHISLLDTLMNASTIMNEHRHAEWFYFPGQEKLQLKTMDLIPKPEMKSSKFQKWTDDFMENTVFQLLSRGCRVMPKATKYVSKLSASAVPTGVKEAYSYDIFPSPRKVKFLEMEYAIPVERFEEALEEIHYVLKSQPFRVHFPIEIRVASGEAGFLSPTQGKNSAFFAFHMYKGMDHESYFKWAHQTMEKYGARPHLGKMNKLTKEDLYTKYPHFESFTKIRDEFDPANVFMTNYFKQLFL